MITALRRVEYPWTVLFWIYLAAITAAEYVTAVIHPQPGLIFHAVILVGLCIHGALAPGEEQRKLALGLTVAPLIRLLSLSLPLPDLPQIVWYPTVSIPLLVATWIIFRQTRLPSEAIGLRIGNLPLQLMLVGAGLGLGLLEYRILRPVPLAGELSWQALWFPVFSLVVFTGFTEEIVFRGVLQALSLPVLGRASIPFVGLLFGVLHIGYLSVLDVVFVSLVGLVFGLVVQWGGSIIGVTLAHGMTNVMLFLILPYTSLNPTSPVAVWMPWIVGSGTSIALVSMLLLFRSARRRSSDVDKRSIGDMIRAARRERNLTYSELARCTNISVRELAMLEHGLHHLNDARRQSIAAQIDVVLHAPPEPDQCAPD